jgi:hypothetical protein
MSFTYTLTQTKSLINLNDASLYLATAGSNVIFSSGSSDMSLGPLGSNLSSNVQFEAPSFRMKNFTPFSGNSRVLSLLSNGVMTSEATNVEVSNLRSTGNITIEGNLTVNGTTTVIDTQNVLIEDPIIQLGLSNVLDTTDVGFIMTANTASGFSNVAFGYRNSTHEVVLGRTPASASDNSLKFDPVQNSIDLRVYGNVYANVFRGDGSQLTGVLTSTPNLQAVTDISEVTTNSIEAAGFRTSTHDGKFQIGSSGAGFASFGVNTGTNNLEIVSESSNINFIFDGHGPSVTITSGSNLHVDGQVFIPNMDPDGTSTMIVGIDPVTGKLMNTGHSITQASGTPELDQVLTQNNVTSNSIVFTGPSAIYAPYSESTLGNLNLTNLSTDDSMPLLAINGSGDVVLTNKTISDIVSEASSALVESQGLDSVLTNNAYSGNTMYLTNTGNSLVTSGTIQVGGDVITTNGNVSARMLHASYSACTDTFLANQAFVTSLRVTGNTAAQFNGSIKYNYW